MKTAAIVYEFPSLSETFIRNQIAGQLELGCDVRIFADGADPLALSYMEPMQDELLRRVTYFGLPLKKLRESVGKLRSRTPVTPQEAVSTDKPSRTVHESGAASLRLRYEARAFGDRSRFDVIHAHFGPNGVRAVRLRKLGVLAGPILTSFYGYDVGRHWTRKGYAELFGSGERFLAISEHMRETLVFLGCPATRITVHRLGVDLERFSPSARRRDSGLEIVSIARLVQKKGLEYALRAVARLRDENITVRYTIAGDGPLRPRLERLAHELGVAGSVDFIGAVPHRAVVDLLNRSDVLLAPSVTAVDGDMEGTPVAILEAQALGIPVVSTRHAGIPEIVDDGRSGFLLAEGDVGGIAERLGELLESPSLRASMGEAGRAIVTEKHDSRRLNRELVQLYERLVEEAAA